MKDHKSFLKIQRKEIPRPAFQPGSRGGALRLRGKKASREQASRCMDCGTPFCHAGCPAGSPVPEWNDALSRGRIKEAQALIESANPFPEITGRLCPAPCERSCVLALDGEAATIRDNELEIIETAFSRRLIRPSPPAERKPLRAAVIGSGPAGLSAAFFLNRMGVSVEVYEKDERIGGLLRYGIPDSKLDKRVLDRRIRLMEAEGVKFLAGSGAGEDIEEECFLREFDAVCLAAGSRVPRDLEIPGRDLSGIHFALDYLIQANRRASGEKIDPGDSIEASGKKVVVIGGGDTGADCALTAAMQGAASVAQVEIMPRSPAEKTLNGRDGNPAERLWEVMTVGFSGEGGRVNGLECVRVRQEGRSAKEIAGTGFMLKADLVIIAAGFTGSVREGAAGLFGAAADGRGLIRTSPSFMTNREKIFAAGDMRRGQSLIIHAVTEGRECARGIGRFLARKAGAESC